MTLSFSGCTEEAKICPDGNTVGGISPLCEFEECSSTTSNEVSNGSTASSAIDETADWNTYRNEEYGFEFMYPRSFLRPRAATLSLNPDFTKQVEGIETEHRVNVEHCGGSGLPEHCTPYTIDTTAGFFIVDEDYDSVKDRYKQIEI